MGRPNYDDDACGASSSSSQTDLLQNFHGLSSQDLEPFLVPKNLLVNRLAFAESFSRLSRKEKRYIHHLSKALHYGLRISARQMCREYPLVEELILTIFGPAPGETSPDFEGIKRRSGVSDEEWEHFTSFVTFTISNRSLFAFWTKTKNVPRLTPNQFARIVAASHHVTEAMELFDRVSSYLFAVKPESKNRTGFPGEEGHCDLYEGLVTEKDAELVKRFWQDLGRPADALGNTYLVKHDDGHLEIRVACIEASANELHEFEGNKIVVSYGADSEDLVRVVDQLKAAIPFAQYPLQIQLLHMYINHFTNGSCESLREVARLFVLDKDAVIEMNMGYGWGYGDPDGSRGIFDGFVGAADTDQSVKYCKLVHAAREILRMMPYPEEYHSEFEPPAFKAIELLTTRGFMSGIALEAVDEKGNICGMKQFEFSNIAYSARSKQNFYLSDSDHALLAKHGTPVLSFIIGLHELLGHGAGKDFSEDESGLLNFDRDTTRDPLTGKLIQSWYKPGQSFANVFGSFASSYEECRAELGTLVLSHHPSALSVFGFEKGTDAAEDAKYIVYGSMCLQGLIAVGSYDVKAKKIHQAHGMARFVILRAMMECGFASVKVEPNNAAQVSLRFNRNLLNTKACDAARDLLLKMQVSRATGDVNAIGTTEFHRLATLPEDLEGVRKIVAMNLSKRGCPVFVQGSTFLNKDTEEVELREYEPSYRGVVQGLFHRVE
ncbi:peptidase family M49-domain-containing protein [Powellomyces hirtus]|nr:peptidase family M49-domain-containing protein [Powellomyces hirtus]